MIVDKRIQKYILKGLPNNIELCNSRMVYNKVRSFDFFRIIPKGKKFIMWFKKYDDKTFTYFLEYFKNRVVNIHSFECCYSDELTIGRYGTICYGTIFKCDNVRYYTIEDVMYYKSKHIGDSSWNIKMNAIKSIMNDTRQTIFTLNGIVIGTPIMGITYEKVMSQIQKTPYNVYSIEYIKNTSRTIFKHSLDVFMNQMTIDSAVFLVKPRIKSDVYELYCIENGIEKQVDIAYIPDYKTSVMMNKYFRKIKENDNLDALEESDDEDEFENIDPDKYVFMDREYKFECKYNKKFNMWVPMTRCTDKDIVQSSLLYRMSKTSR